MVVSKQMKFVGYNKDQRNCVQGSLMISQELVGRRTCWVHVAQLSWCGNAGTVGLRKAHSTVGLS